MTKRQHNLNRLLSGRKLNRIGLRYSLLMVWRWIITSQVIDPISRGKFIFTLLVPGESDDIARRAALHISYQPDLVEDLKQIRSWRFAIGPNHFYGDLPFFVGRRQGDGQAISEEPVLSLLFSSLYTPRLLCADRTSH